MDDRFGNQHLAAAYSSQLKTRTQEPGESLQEFAIAFEKLVHSAYLALPENHVRKKAGKAFVNGLKDPGCKVPVACVGREDS
jgi:hypothetical protein